MPTMNITREDLNACTVKLKIDCEPTQVREGYDRAFKQASKKIKLPGFRPGTVPKAMIQQYLDEEELKDLAAENVVKSTFRKAMEEQGLEPYRTPQVEVASFDLDAGSCSYVLTVPLAPKVKLGEFDGLEVARPNPDVSDSEVDEQIEEIRRRRSTREAVTDRGSQEGDMAVVNMLPDGAEGTGRNFMIVVGQTFAELDAAVAGMAIDEVKHLTLKFPDGFGEKDWAGKEMGVQLTLRSLNAIVLPELDEEFAQSMNVENVEDLRARVRDGMRNAKLQAVEDYVNEQLLEAMLQRSEVEVPDTLWQEVASRRVGILMEDLREAKKSVEDYAQEQGMSLDELQAAIEREARTQVLRAQMIQEIYQLEDLKVTDQDLTLELITLSRQMNTTPDTLLADLRKNKALNEVYHQAVHRKVMGFLRSKAKIVDATPA